jgi:hypothetical protein
MDLRTALASVADQITVRKTSKKNASSKKNKHQNSKKKQVQKKEDDSSEHAASLDFSKSEYEDSGLEELQKHKAKITNNLAAAKRAYKELQEIDAFYTSKKEALAKACEENDLNNEEYITQAIDLISSVKEKLSDVVYAPGLRVYIKRATNECNSLLDGLSEQEVSIETLTLSTLDNAIARVRNLIRIYTKKAKAITDTDESAVLISSMLDEFKSKKMAEVELTDANNLTIVSGYSIIPLGSFSAKLLKQYFNCDASSGYPILYNQSFLVVSIEDSKKIDINEKLAELSNPSSPYVLVTKMPKAKGKFFLYWIMTQRNLNNLKKSAAYQDYMMLHDWSFI